jgi:hypothetical protein
MQAAFILCVENMWLSTNKVVPKVLSDFGSKLLGNECNPSQEENPSYSPYKGKITNQSSIAVWTGRHFP